LKQSGLFLLSILLCAGFVSELNAQNPKDLANAPVAAQISAARKVFVANAGGESVETVIQGGSPKRWSGSRLQPVLRRN
jgi:hypothetical protein